MLIGVTGAKGAGKDTFAKRLITNHGFRKLAFAQPLKDMLRVLGLSNEEIEGSLKEMPCALLGGASPRHAMQTLGTEWGRNLVDGNIWLTAWLRNYEQLKPKHVICTDVRFDNEAEMFQKQGGIIVEIIRSGLLRNDGHLSEKGVDPRFVSWTISNSGTIVDLKKRADEFAARIGL